MPLKKRMKSKSAYLVIAHGSRDPQANAAFGEFLLKLRRALRGREVHGAFLELAKPSIPEALEEVLSKGAEEIFVLPMMFFPGRHVKQDIPKFIEEAKAKYPRADFHFATPVADHPLMVQLLKKKAQSAKGKKR